MKNRLDDFAFQSIASSLGLPAKEVKRAVVSFFDSMLCEAKKLPFDTARKIYSPAKFGEYSRVWNVPSVGRFGPAYSRYLLWRRNESRLLEQEPRSNYRFGLTQSEIETMAEEILSGSSPSPLIKKKGSDLYQRVWLVGKMGKKSARQVIPKKKEDVQD